MFTPDLIIQCVIVLIGTPVLVYAIWNRKTIIRTQLEQYERRAAASARPRRIPFCSSPRRFITVDVHLALVIMGFALACFWLGLIGEIQNQIHGVVAPTPPAVHAHETVLFLVMGLVFLVQVVVVFSFRYRIVRYVVRSWTVTFGQPADMDLAAREQTARRWLAAALTSELFYGVVFLLMALWSHHSR